MRILRRASSRLDLIEDLSLDHALGDVLDEDSLRRAMEGCQWVFHSAAVADYWRSPRVTMYLVNVEGTRLVFKTAKAAGVERVVVTSSAAAVGLRADGTPADESDPFNLPVARFPYGHSKAISEGDAQRAVAEGLPVVLVNPTVVFGPGDLNLISGSMVAEFARGVIPPFYPPGAITAIDVRDVARAHLAAAERGTPGERYILGTEDITYKALFALIAEIVGKRPPMLPLPRVVAPLLSRGVNALKALGAAFPIDGNQVWLSAQNVCFNSAKARQVLGTPQITLRQSLTDTYAWYKEKGMVP